MAGIGISGCAPRGMRAAARIASEHRTSSGSRRDGLISMTRPAFGHAPIPLIGIFASLPIDYFITYSINGANAYLTRHYLLFGINMATAKQ